MTPAVKAVTAQPVCDISARPLTQTLYDRFENFENPVLHTGDSSQFSWVLARATVIYGGVNSKIDGKNLTKMVTMTRYNPYYKSVLNTVPMLLSKRPSTQMYKNSGSRTRFTNKRTKAVTGRSLKKLIKSTESAKHYTFETNGALTHNTIVTCVPTQNPIAGTSNIGRIGDDIYLCALKIHGQFLSNSVAGAYTYRILVGWSGEEVTTVGAGTTFVSGLGGTEVFLPGTFTTWTPNGIINPKAFTLLHDETIDINSQIAATVDSNSFAFTVPINQDFLYQSAGSIQGKTRNLCVVVVGSVANGVTGVTASGNIIMAADLIFKD